MLRSCLVLIALTVLAATTAGVAVAADGKVTGTIVLDKKLPDFSGYKAVLELSYEVEEDGAAIPVPVQGVTLYQVSHEAGKESRLTFEIGAGHQVFADAPYSLYLEIQNADGQPAYTGSFGKTGAVLTNGSPNKVTFKLQAVEAVPAPVDPPVDPPVKPKPGIKEKPPVEPEPGVAPVAPAATGAKVGDVVWAEWKENDWYKGKISKASPKGYTIDFDDGETATVKATQLALDKAPDKAGVVKGTRVLAKWEDGRLYPAKVAEIKKTGAVTVDFEDGATGEAVLKELRVILK